MQIEGGLRAMKIKKSVICLKSENLHKHRGTAEDKMSIMGKNANLWLTNFSKIAAFLILDKTIAGGLVQKVFELDRGWF